MVDIGDYSPESVTGITNMEGVNFTVETSPPK